MRDLVKVQKSRIVISHKALDNQFSEKIKSSYIRLFLKIGISSTKSSAYVEIKPDRTDE